MKGTVNPMEEEEPIDSADGRACGARTRSGGRCRRAKARGRSRCRLHGGAPGSGAPHGERNGRYKDGANTKNAIAERRWARTLVHELANEKVGRVE